MWLAIQLFVPLVLALVDILVRWAREVSRIYALSTAWIASSAALFA